MASVKALEWLIQTRQQAVRTITDLQGLTACSQLITLANGERYVLRTQSQRATDYGVNYQQEAQLLRHIAPLGIAPTPIYTDENASLLAWIDGEVPTAFRPDLLRKLADTMAKLHHYEISRDAMLASALSAIHSKNFTRCTDGRQHGVPTTIFPKLDIAERCQFLWDKLSPEKQLALPFSPPFQPITPFRHALCHHDVHLGNLVEQGDRLFLIDWEYAAISDPALDLALFLHANRLSERDQQLFLRCYFADFPQDLTPCINKIAEYQSTVQILSDLWYAI